MRGYVRTKKERRGFTLIEMLISLSIFGVITAFAVANFRAGEQGEQLRISTQNVASLIRRARTLSVAGYEVKYCHGGNAEGQVCPGGDDASCLSGECLTDIPPAYGINIAATSGLNREVRVFADTNDNGRYDQGEAIRTDQISPRPFVVISDIAPADANQIDIVFEPPKPNITFNGSRNEGIATIELTHTATDRTAEIIVNRISGLVSVDY